MRRYILNIIITSLVIFGLSISVTNFVSAIWFAIALSFLNTFIRPVLIVLSLPLTLITFGLFLIIVNTLVIILADKLIDGIEIHGFWYAVLFSLCLSAVQSLIEPHQSKEIKN